MIETMLHHLWHSSHFISKAKQWEWWIKKMEHQFTPWNHSPWMRSHPHIHFPCERKMQKNEWNAFIMSFNLIKNLHRLSLLYSCRPHSLCFLSPSLHIYYNIAIQTSMLLHGILDVKATVHTYWCRRKCHAAMLCNIAIILVLHHLHPIVIPCWTSPSGCINEVDATKKQFDQNNQNQTQMRFTFICFCAVSVYTFIRARLWSCINWIISQPKSSSLNSNCKICTEHTHQTTVYKYLHQWIHFFDWETRKQRQMESMCVHPWLFSC